MNKTAANGSRRTLSNGMRAYLDAVDATMKRGSERAVVRCDADAYALILIKLAQEQLRSVVSLMGETRPNFVGAAACARSAFELGVRGLWMCTPDDPQERMRRVAILDRDDETLAEEMFRNNVDQMADDEKRQISEYISRYKTVVRETTIQGVAEVGNFPKFKRVMDELGMGELYFYYRLLSQFTHGGRASFYFVCKPTLDEESGPADFVLRSPSTIFRFGQFVKPFQWFFLASAAMAGVLRPTQAAFARVSLCEGDLQQLFDAEDRFEQCLRAAYSSVPKPDFDAALGTAHEQLQQLVDRAQPAAQASRLGGFLAAMASVGDLSATQSFQG